MEYSSTRQKDSRFYVQGGGRDRGILKEKRNVSRFRHLCRPHATSEEVDSGLGV
jgi:hypothetical protein